MAVKQKAKLRSKSKSDRAVPAEKEAGLVASTKLRTAAEVSGYIKARGQLAAAEAKLAPLRKQVKDFESGLIEDVNTYHSPEAKVVIADKLAVSACASAVTAVDTKQLIRIIGQRLFNAMASMKVTDIRQHLTPKEVEQVLTEARVGRRTITIIEG